MTEEHRTHSPSKERKTSIHDIRNQDFVSRLLAATPPYLYSAPVGSNNFFFSDMLRSLVQARNNENARNLQLQQAALARRPRKRSWSQHRPYYEHVMKERKEEQEKPTEKPLELTNKQLFPITAKYSKFDATTLKDVKHQTSISSENKIQSNNTEYEQSQSITNDNSGNSIIEPPAASLPPSELVLPPPPPVWYPPLYPPYGIDPLHFFIDLRVSGHIYDRKKENVSPLTNTENNNISPNSTTENDNFSKHRLGSAFSVPLPRSESKTASVINLSASNSNNGNKLTDYGKYYDLTSEAKENQPTNQTKVSTSIPRFESIHHHNSRLYGSSSNYSSLSSTNVTEDDNVYEIDSKSDQENSNDFDRPQSKENIDVEMIDNVKPSRMNNDKTNNLDVEEHNQIHQIH